ncbi:MAG: thioredoxin family protein, partial [Mariniblastus sp.]
MSFTSATPTPYLVDQLRFLIISTLLVFLSAFSISLGQEVGFTEDAAKAIQQAQAENKDVIFLFTGSDWCPPCKKLEKEVLS